MSKDKTSERRSARRQFLLKKTDTLTPKRRTEAWTKGTRANGIPFTSSSYRDRVDYFERAHIVRSSGKFVTKTDGEGQPFQWRLPSPYRVKHQGWRNFETPTTGEITWKKYGHTGTTRVSGFPPASHDIVDTRKFMRNQYEPLISYNELARHDVALLNKIKDQKVNAGLALAEFASSARTLLSLSNTLLGVISNIKRGRFKKAISYFKPADLKGVRRKGFSTKDPAGRWLELQYGIKPIMADINGTLEYLNENIETPKVLSVAHSFYEEVPSHLMYNSPTRGKFTGDGYRGCRTKVYFTLEDSALREASRLGLTNGLAIAWDVIPYSLVVDWFMPVSNMLAALDATAGLKFVSGTRTKFCSASYTGWYNTPVHMPEIGTTIDVPMERTGDLFAMQREVLSGFPMVRPYLTNPFSLTRAASAVALIRMLKP
ncbi:MAG: putative maturation protein [Leviviridae sp.]|nr:MAG: putative maturation protein [Leviviridae sp.]